MRQEIAPERRARLICKLLEHNPALGIDRLRLLSSPDLSRSHAQRRVRRISTPDDFDSALTLAIGRGWLKHDEDKRFVLTAAGREVGLRTRSGSHRRRLDQLGLD
jgi:hypothetical protein